ncbi:MAG: TM2 domain-containing protein [Micrococcaceae bacterium]|nr:TM2 domain-containing protein [Micrococcaceae bacterium]
METATLRGPVKAPLKGTRTPERVNHIPKNLVRRGRRYMSKTAWKLATSGEWPVPRSSSSHRDHRFIKKYHYQWDVQLLAEARQKKHKKSRFIAWTLFIFTGFLGGHSYYLGYIGIGLTRTLLAVGSFMALFLQLGSDEPTLFMLTFVLALATWAILALWCVNDFIELVQLKVEDRNEEIFDLIAYGIFVDQQVEELSKR